MISYSTLDDTTPNIYVILKLDGTTNNAQSPYERAIWFYSKFK